MKKTVCMLALGTLLVGCSSTNDSSYVTSLKDGNKTVMEGEGVTVSKNDIYMYLLDQYGSSQVVDMALSYICDKEITDQEAIDKKKQETLDEYTKYMEEDIDTYAKNLGFDDQQGYIDEMIIPTAKRELLKEKYINDKYDSIVKEYKVKYLKVITLDTESEALEIIDKTKDIETFDKYLSEKSGQDHGMVTTESSIDKNIIAKLDKFTKDGMYSKAIKTKDDKYAIVYVYNTDKSKLKDEIKDNLQDIAAITSDCESYYLKQYKFDVYEQKIKDDIKEKNEDYIG